MCLSAWPWDACDRSPCWSAALYCAVLGCSCRAASLDRATKASKSSSLELYAAPPSDLNMHERTIVRAHRGLQVVCLSYGNTSHTHISPTLDKSIDVDEQLSVCAKNVGQSCGTQMQV